MAIIPQQKLFRWEELQTLGDLKRLRLVLSYMPDENLMRTLERKRGNGRDDYPIRALWNSLLAGIVYEHERIEQLRRELARNGQLRALCGFDSQVPPAYVYSRFFKILFAHEAMVNDIFDNLVKQLKEILPDFGKRLAIDSKAISSFAKHKNKNQKPDGRRDTDADYGKKKYTGIDKEGRAWGKVISWFGYKLHLIVDAAYELPVLFSVSKASVPDINEGRELIEELEHRQPDIIKTCQKLTADKGYDDVKFITKLWDKYEIKPVIDIRNMWKDPDKTRLLTGQTNVTYNYKGNVYCYCPQTGKERELSNGGFEKDRNTIKKLCPAQQYGIECKGLSQCPVKQGIRIPLYLDRRIFTPIDRASYKWKREYNKRSSVERVNSRLDVSFGFEVHTIRSLAKMKIRSGLALCVMLAMALGRIRENQADKMRSLVRSA